MNMTSTLIIVAVIMVVLYLGVWYWQKANKKGYKIIVYYSEKIGDTIVENPTPYDGLVIEEQDLLSIPKLKLKRPAPPRKYMLPTFGGNKLIYLIKIDNERYAYRIPSLKNQVLTYQRDEKGNIIKSNGRPVIIKHKWILCDDIIEPDVKHWEENYAEEVRKRRLERKNFIEKFLPFIAITMIFIFAVIAMNISTKQLTADKKAIMLEAEETVKNAQSTQQGLNNLIEKITGQKILGNEVEDRQAYYNATK